MVRRWWPVLKRTVTEFREDNLTDWAAALTYYSVLAIFPALIVLVSILGPGRRVGHAAPDRQPRHGRTRSRQGHLHQRPEEPPGRPGRRRASCSWSACVGALWSASGYVGAFMRASNVIYDIDEGRPVWKTLPVRVSLTLVLLTLLAISTIAVVLTGALAREGRRPRRRLATPRSRVWNIAKWPVLLVVVSFMFALLYWAAPNVKHPGFRWISPGGVLAVVAWLIASGAFALFVSNFGSYNKTYGALGGVVVFLVWLWISNIVILLGAEFNAELERQRAIEGGMEPPDKEPFVEPRDTRKIEHQEAS